MITEQDLQEAIAECQGVRNPNASTAIKLAAFLTIQREMFGVPEPTRIEHAASYSYASDPPEPTQQYSGDERVGEYGNSDFLQAISGHTQPEMWAIMDELMDTLKMVNKRVYDGIMRKIQ